MGLQNNTPKSIDMRNELSILKLILDSDTPKDNTKLKAKILKLENELLSYKAPEREYALSF